MQDKSWPYNGMRSTSPTCRDMYEPMYTRLRELDIENSETVDAAIWLADAVHCYMYKLYR